jgi:hypothetical protein
MMKFKLFIFSLLLSSGLFAQTARVQIIHNSPEPTVDIYVNGVQFLTDFEFRTATPFVDVPAGVPLQIGVAPSPSSGPLDIIATFPATFVDGETYVVMAQGVVGNMMTPFDLNVFPLGQEASGSPSDIDILAFHGSPDAPAVDITARGVATIFSDLAYGNFDGYISVPDGNYILDISPAGSSDVVASFEAGLEGLGGAAAVVFASGYLGGSPAFGLFAALPDGAVVELPALTEARLQIIHNSPSPTVDIWVNDQPFLTDFEFRTATAFVSVPGNTELNIGVAPSPSNSPADIIATFPVNLLAGETYTVVANGIVGNMDTPFNLEAFAPSREAAVAADAVDLLVFHGSPNAPAVDIAVRGVGNVVEGLEFTDFQGYLEGLDTVDVILDIKLAGTETVVVSYEAPLSILGGASATVFASGLLGEDPQFGLFAALADGTVVELPVAEEEAETALLQIIHNSPSPTVDVWVNDEPFLLDVAYLDATAFLEVPAGVELAIGIAPSPSSSPADIIATFPVTLAADESYIAIANGVVGDLDKPFNLEIFVGGRQTSTEPEGVDLLIFHGSPDAPNVDIDIRGLGAVVEDLAFGVFEGYLESDIAPDVILDIRPAGSPTVVASFVAPLSALEGLAAVVMASGYLGEEPNFGLNAVLPDGTVIPLEQLTTARVQIIHNSPSPTVDIWVNEQPFLPNFAFRTATPFVDVPGNVELNIGVAPSPSNSPADIIANFPVTLLPGETYVVIANGVVGDMMTPFNLEIFEGGLESNEEADEVALLVFHGSPDAPGVDVDVQGVGNLVENIEFGSFDGYYSVPAANYILDISPAGTGNVLVSYRADLETLGGGAATVFASGFLADTPGFGLFAALPDGTVIPLPVVTSTEEVVFTGFEVSPNPTAGLLQLQWSALTDTRVEIQLWDLQGRMVKSNTTDTMTGNQVFSLDMSDLNSGLYILQLIPENGIPVQTRIAKN